MHRRYDAINIPIELLRTLVAISELGTVAKAADALHLTQPAISAQIKRLQQIVGTEILEKGGAGIRATAQGEMVVKYGRRILAMNDQILQQSRSHSGPAVVRIGVTPLLASNVLLKMLTSMRDIDGNVQIECARSSEVASRLHNGHIDLAVMPTSRSSTIEAQSIWTERMVWASAPDFLLSPGRPIPLIGWPGSVSHQLAIDALDRAGQPYTLAFIADDWAARVVAMQAGLGYLAIPERAADPAFKIAREHFLPPLPDLNAGIFVRDNALPEQFDTVVEALNGVFATAQMPRSPVTQSSKRKGRAELAELPHA